MAETDRDYLNASEGVEMIKNRERDTGRIEQLLLTTPEDEKAIQNQIKPYKTYSVTTENGEDAKVYLTQKPFGVEIRAPSFETEKNIKKTRKRIEEATNVEAQVTNTGRYTIITIPFKGDETRIDLFLDPSFQDTLKQNNIKLGENSPDKTLTDIFEELYSNNYEANEMRRGSLLYKTRENMDPDTWNNPPWT